MVKAMRDLAPNPKNPRKITDARLAQLKKALHEFGDLGCFVFNRSSGQLVAGHQRAKHFDKNAEVQIVEKYKKPTRTGTVAEGFVILDGERYKYREVVWDAVKEKAAAIAANRTAGDWDLDILGEWLAELSSLDVDLDLTMLDEKEQKKFMLDLSDGDKDEQGALDKKKGRVASNDVKQVTLVFTDESLEEFTGLVEYFQKELQIDSITDTILEVLRSARDAAEAES